MTSASASRGAGHFRRCAKDQVPIAGFEDPHQPPVSVAEALRADCRGGNGGSEYNKRTDLPQAQSDFAKAARKGRLAEAGHLVRKPLYYRNMTAFDNGDGAGAELHNHEMSKQSRDGNCASGLHHARAGDTQAQATLKKKADASKKRNYNLLDPEGVSPTVVTMPDDFVHYAEPRALTVREMAPVQSFDDDFVFRASDQPVAKRAVEVPQYTLVGNAVPLLWPRASIQNCSRKSNERVDSARAGCRGVIRSLGIQVALQELTKRQGVKSP